MDVKLRVQTCKVIEHIRKHLEYANQLGLEDTSVFHGEREISKYNLEEEIKNV